MNKESMTFEEFLCELKKKLPFPDEMSEVEMNIALNDFNNGMDIDAVADHLIYG